MPKYRQQWQVLSSDGKREYTVSVTFDNIWSCSCIGWTRHFPRRDCHHIKDKKEEIGGASAPEGGKHPVGTTRVPLPGATGTDLPSAPTVRSALKHGATPEEATDVARAKREEVQAKKDAKLSKYRYGFQLAHTYEPSDLDRGTWVAEIKFDGELGMLIDGKIISRSGSDWTHRFPEIEKATDAVLVGEIVVLDSSGQSYFNKIQERSTDNPIKIKAMSREFPVTFMAFDMLEMMGQNLTVNPLSVRRSFLEAYFRTFSFKSIKITEQIPISSDADVQALVNECRKRETEGVMLKDMGAPYVAKRGRNWVKAKTWQEREFDVVRFEETGIGDGFVIYVVNKGRECRVNCGSFKMREAIRAGHKRVEIKFLSESEDGALRFPSLRRLLGEEEGQ